MTSIVIFAETNTPLFHPKLSQDTYAEHRSLDFVATIDSEIIVRDFKEYPQARKEDINILWIAGYGDLDNYQHLIRPDSLLIFDFAWEGGTSEETREDLLARTKNIRFIMNYSDRVSPEGEFDKPKEFTYCWDYFAASAARRKMMEESSDVPVRDRSRKLCYLAGKIKKDSRFLIAYQLYNKKLLDNTVLSLLGQDTDFDKFRKRYSKFIPTQFYTDIKPYIKPYFPLPNFEVDTRSEVGSVYVGWPNDRRLYDLSSVSIVVETSDRFSGADPGFHTEKLYRTIYNRHPFVLQGCKNMLSLLQKKGFKTFSPIIDESYDKLPFIRGKKERGYEFNNAWLLVTRATELLKSIDMNYGRLQHIVDYNYNHMMSHASKEVKGLHRFVRQFINNSKGK